MIFFNLELFKIIFMNSKITLLTINRFFSPSTTKSFLGQEFHSRNEYFKFFLERKPSRQFSLRPYLLWLSWKFLMCNFRSENLAKNFLLLWQFPLWSAGPGRAKLSRIFKLLFDLTYLDSNNVIENVRHPYIKFFI